MVGSSPGSRCVPGCPAAAVSAGGLRGPGRRRILGELLGPTTRELWFVASARLPPAAQPPSRRATRPPGYRAAGPGRAVGADEVEQVGRRPSSGVRVVGVGVGQAQQLGCALHGATVGAGSGTSPSEHADADARTAVPLLLTYVCRLHRKGCSVGLTTLRTSKDRYISATVKSTLPRCRYLLLTIRRFC
jgi:hypothetical protein